MKYNKINEMDEKVCENQNLNHQSNQEVSPSAGITDKAIGSSGLPEKVTMDKSGANKAGINTINLMLAMLYIFGGLPFQIMVRQIKYLNNLVEQDHRFIKKITDGMRGFKSFNSAEATLFGIELHHMLRKNQHSNSNSMTIFEQFYGLAA